MTLSDTGSSLTLRAELPGFKDDDIDVTVHDTTLIISGERKVEVPEPVLRYAARVVRASDPTAPEAPEVVRRALRYGAGVRGAQSLVLAAKAVALCDGRANASFEDVRRVAKPALRHRLIPNFAGQAEGVDPDQLLAAIVRDVPE